MSAGANSPTLSKYGDWVLRLADKFGDVAAKGTVRFLLGFGGVVLVLAFATKLSIPSLHINAATQPVEFVAMLLVGLVIILSGAVVACQPGQRLAEIVESERKRASEKKRAEDPSPATAPTADSNTSFAGGESPAPPPKVVEPGATSNFTTGERT